MTRILRICVALCLALPLAAQQSPQATDDQLVYTLTVMRHGVRSPTAEPSRYDRFSSAPWPAWPVASTSQTTPGGQVIPPGNLTPHGYRLIGLLAGFDRQAFAQDHLLTPTGCDDSTRVTLHADSDQRTRETARALAEGLFPGCPPPVQALDEGQDDPLFHLDPASFTPQQAQSAAAAVLQRAGGSPEAPAATFHAPLADFDALLATCGVSTPRPGRTSLLTIPAVIQPGTGDHAVEMRGPLNTASTLSEILLLEYVEGMPMQNVGWGCVPPVRLRTLIGLHTAASQLLLRTPQVAIPQATPLLRAIAASLRQAAQGSPVPGAVGRPNDKLVVLVGHDTNLNNLAGALHLDWFADGRANDTPPGSALAFQLWRNPRSHSLSVRILYTTQTLEQMRNATPLTLREPPVTVPVAISGCTGPNATCSADSFQQLLTRTLSAP